MRKPKTQTKISELLPKSGQSKRMHPKEEKPVRRTRKKMGFK